MNEKQLAKIRKNNLKLYPIYKMIGLDWIFYYGIRILFLTQVKNISAADIVLATTVYGICYILLQIPNTVILSKIGKKNAIVLGQLLNLISMGATLYCPNYAWLLFAQFFSAMGFGLKQISESSFLSASIPKSKNKGDIFSKIDGKGYSRFCYIGAISVLISGFLYDINPYIPIILCMLANLTALIISLCFVDIENMDENKKETNLKQEVNSIFTNLRDGFKFILNSKRLRSLLIFLGVLWGIIDIFATYQETLLKELNIPSYYIGIILASFQMLVGIFSTKSIEFNKKYKNHSLTYIGLMLTIGSVILGIGVVLNVPFTIQLMITMIVFIFRAYGKGIYQVIKRRYINNFSDNEILPKIYSINGIASNIGKIIIATIASIILKINTLGNALIILGVITTIFVIILFLYSKNKLGLKPEEYELKDITY